MISKIGCLESSSHSHPNSDPTPSGADGDMGFAAVVQKACPYVELNVYTPKPSNGFNYHPYDKQGPLPHMSMPAVIVTNKWDLIN